MQETLDKETAAAADGEAMETTSSTTTTAAAAAAATTNETEADDNLNGNGDGDGQDVIEAMSRDELVATCRALRDHARLLERRVKESEAALTAKTFEVVKLKNILLTSYVSSATESVSSNKEQQPEQSAAAAAVGE